ncbi:DUF4173 domain-containing protein [Bifidobacterium sp. ESL0769]|uniref:DUF4153 domain-containing protein n=1 Tax=Bifidobacterium sp. ESL0769 TaxID=2983229 RepID=UPI0023F8F06F|nr:DUF4153 domain-containing protein [Bifidobacterium sp. ESL0769]WEV68136.1 DUF4173 domain-containing protein [Bifidobacterium sp. ESL0769]
MDKDNSTQNQPESAKNAAPVNSANLANQTTNKPNSASKPATGPNSNPYLTGPNANPYITGPNANPYSANSAVQPSIAQAMNPTNTAAQGSGTTTATAKAPLAPLTKADKVSLLCALGLSLLWCVCVSPVLFSGYFALTGGAALSVCLLAFLGCAWWLRRKQGTQAAKKTNVLKGAKRLKLQMPKSSYALLFCTIALMLVPAFSQAAWIRLINACALAIALPLTFLLLSGADDNELFRFRGILHGLGTFFVEQFRHWSVLGRVASSWMHGRGRTVGSIAIGAMCAVAVLFVVIPALSSADENFEWLVNRLLANFLHIDLGPRAFDIVRFIMVIPITFSLLFALRHPRQKTANSENATQHSVSTSMLNTMLAMLDAVYLVFVAIQSSYLFGGIDTLKRFGGYAAYARAGFFQLVGVTAINLVIVMACTYFRKNQKRAISLLTLELVLVASTAVMLVSAAWRMNLYVHKYGLTRLRILTYWGMVAIAFLLVVTVVKLLRPRFEWFRIAFFGTLALWLVFAFIQPDAIIANVDVDGYLNGSIEEVDTGYLAKLPSSAIDPLNRLKQQAPNKTTKDAAQIALEQVYENANETVWSTWGI